MDQPHDSTSRGKPSLPGTRAGRLSRSWVLLFPLALWLVGTLYFGGQIGKYADDYGQHLVRPGPDPDRFVLWPWDLDTFSRPLFRSVVFTLNSVFYDAFWMAHIVAALAHLLTALLAVRLLRVLGVWAPAAWAAAIVYLCAPIHFEAALWPSAITTPMGIIALLALLLGYARWSREQRSLWWLPAFALGGLVIASCNEQPTAVVPLMGIVFLATAPRLRPVLPALAQVALPTGCAAAGVLLYAVLYRATATGDARGAGALTPVSEIPGRYLSLLRHANDMLFGGFNRSMMLPAFELGWRSLATPLGIVLLLALPVLGWWWSSRLSRDAHEIAPGERPAWRVAGLCVALGALWYAVLWLPIAVVQQQVVAPRLASGAVLALAVALAGVLHAVLRGRPRLTRGALCVCSGLALTGAITLVGFQARYKQQYDADVAQANELAARLGDLSRDTIILPLSIQTKAADSGISMFDIGLQSGFGPVGARGLVAEAFRRNDLIALALNRWGPIKLDNITAADARYLIPMPFRLEPHPAGGGRIPWDRVAAFSVDATGKLWLNPVIFVEQPDHRDLRLELPIVRAVLDRAWAPNRPFAFQPRDYRPAGETMPWRFAPSGEAVAFERSWAWGIRHDAAWLATRDGQRSRVAMQATIAPSAEARVLGLRATYAEWFQDDRRWGDGVAIEVYIDPQEGEPSTRPAATLDLHPRIIALQRRWVPLRVNIPPGTTPLLIRVHATPGATGDPDWDRVWIAEPRLLPAR